MSIDQDYVLLQGLLNDLHEQYIDYLQWRREELKAEGGTLNLGENIKIFENGRIWKCFKFQLVEYI